MKGFALREKNETSAPYVCSSEQAFTLPTLKMSESKTPENIK